MISSCPTDWSSHEYTELASFAALTTVAGSYFMGRTLGLASGVLATGVRYRLNQLPDGGEPLLKECAVFYISQIALLLFPLQALRNKTISSSALLRYGLVSAGINAGLLAIKATAFQSRRNPPPRTSGLRLCEQNFASAPIMPELKEVEDLEGIPTLTKQATDLGLTRDELRYIGQEPGQPGSRANEAEKTYYQIIHNLAAVIRNIEGNSVKDVRDRQIWALQAFAAACHNCETRRVTDTYDLLVKVNGNFTDPFAFAKNQMAAEASEFKRQVALAVVYDTNLGHSRGFGATQRGIWDTMHLWSAIIEECGTELGVTQGPINPEAVYYGSHGNANERFQGMSQTARQYLGNGRNKQMFIADVKRAYCNAPVDDFIQKVKEALNRENTFRLQLLGQLAEHLAGQPGAQGKIADSDNWYEPDHPVAQIYCEKRTGENALYINNEGIILLMKMTGYLVDDGRLHMAATNEEILRDS